MTTVTTQHNNIGRTGANLEEWTLTTANVTPATFGLCFSRPVEGHIYAQPLYVPGVAIAGQGTHDVVYVATMHNRVYAFDGQARDVGQPLWKRSLEPPVSLPDGNIGYNCHPYHDIADAIGIVSTPVIDVERSTMYLVTFTRTGSAGSDAAQYSHWLHALDIRSGRESTGSPVQIQASVPGTGDGAANGTLTFASRYHNQRCALLLAGGTIYIAFASYCDTGPYHGWVLAYNQDTLHQRGAYTTTPNGAAGGIWQAGQGPAGDPQDHLYVISGNGDFDAQRANFGDSFVKLDPDLSLTDWFTPFNQEDLDAADNDLGSAGPLMLPGTSLLVGGGKEGKLYLLNREDMGHFDPEGDRQIVQGFQATGVLDEHGKRPPAGTHHIHSSPVHWEGPDGARVYVWGENDWLRAFGFDGRRFPPMPGVLQLSDKAILPETAVGRPSVADTGSQVVLAWTGTDPQPRVNVATSVGGHRFANKVTLGESSVDGPGLAFGGGRAYLAWTGSDPGHHLNVMSSADGVTFTGKVTLGEQSSFGPTLAFGNGRLFLAWAGIGNQMLNVMSSADGVTFTGKVTLPDTTGSAPGLSFIDGTLYLLWQGTDPVHRLNVMSSTDGVHFAGKVTLAESSDSCPALARSGELCLSWTGRDAARSLNVMTGASPATLGNKRTFTDSGDAAPGLVVHAGQLLLSWAGTDSPAHVNTTVLQEQPRQVTSPMTAPQGMPGAMLSISADGARAGTGVLWASLPLSGDANQQVVPGILRAFDASDVSRELWNSAQNARRDAVGNFAKFCPPTVADGKVFLGTFSGELRVYGLL